MDPSLWVPEDCPTELGPTLTDLDIDEIMRSFNPRPGYPSSLYLQGAGGGTSQSAQTPGWSMRTADAEVPMELENAVSFANDGLDYALQDSELLFFDPLFGLDGPLLP